MFRTPHKNDVKREKVYVIQIPPLGDLLILVHTLRHTYAIIAVSKYLRICEVLEAWKALESATTMISPLRAYTPSVSLKQKKRAGAFFVKLFWKSTTGGTILTNHQAINHTQIVVDAYEWLVVVLCFGVYIYILIYLCIVFKGECIIIYSNCSVSSTTTSSSSSSSRLLVW